VVLVSHQDQLKDKITSNGQAIGRSLGSFQDQLQAKITSKGQAAGRSTGSLQDQVQAKITIDCQATGSRKEASNINYRPRLQVMHRPQVEA
jgi:hypothetical protein